MSAATVDVAGREFVIRFPFDEHKLAAVRKMPSREYDPNTKEWRAPVMPANIEMIEILVGNYGFEPSRDAIAAMNGTVKQGIFYTSGDSVQVHVPKSFKWTDVLEPLFGAWSARNMRWTVPLAPHAVIGLSRLIEDGELTADAAARTEIAARLPDALATTERHREMGQRSREAAAHMNILGLGGELRPYQLAGVAYALETRRCMIADEMGLGKTVQALAAIQAADTYPALVVSPAVVKENWKREAEKWLPGKTVQVLASTKVPDTLELAVPDVFIINYDVLWAWADWLAAHNLKALIADESHYTKNPDAGRTKAVHKIAKQLPRDGLCLLLTGTPVLNRPGEIISQLDIMGRAQDLGGKRYLQRRYTDWNGSARNEIELNRRLRATCYVRREKSEVLKELPAKQRATVLLDVKMGAAYAQVRAETVKWLSANQNNPRANEATKRAKFDVLKAEITSSKMKVAIEWINEFLDSGRKLVVFAYHRAVQAELVEAFPGCAHVLGSDSRPSRQEAIDDFQSNPDRQLIICSLKAAGIGLTLTAASDVAFVEMGWTPADQDQAEDRCHRFGQEDSVTAWYLLAKGTEDVDIAELIDSKRAVVTAVNDGRLADPSASIINELTARLLMEGPR